MKKIYIIIIFFCGISFGAAAQNGGQPAKVNGGYVNTDTTRYDRHLSICDTMNHIFMVILDSFKDANQLNASANQAMATNARYTQNNNPGTELSAQQSNTSNNNTGLVSGAGSNQAVTGKTGSTSSNSGGTVTTSKDTTFGKDYRANTSKLPYNNTSNSNPNPNHIIASHTRYNDSADRQKKDASALSSDSTTDLPYTESTATNASYSDTTASRPAASTDNNNILTGSPFVYYCPYLSGKDSAYMFTVFNELASDVKGCLLRGPVKNMNVMLMRDPQNPRTLRYGFFITDLKPGADPKMKKISVQIEFNPDTKGVYTDNFTQYRVNLLIHP